MKFSKFLRTPFHYRTPPVAAYVSSYLLTHLRSMLPCNKNQMTGFYMMVTSTLNGLVTSCSIRFYVFMLKFYSDLSKGKTEHITRNYV